MSAKTSPMRRAAFMAAVAETGNQTLACERAKVSRSWVTLHRATDPAFRAELEAAISTARARLAGARAAGGTMAPGRGWGSAGGEELVARGGNGRRTQIARARLRQWTPRIEARFLAALAGCCNVKAACAAAGLSVPSAYNHRQRWPAFAARWDAALEEGYLRIETALIENVAAAFDPPATPPAVTIAGIGFTEAIQLLRLHQRQVRGVGKAPGAWRRPRSLDEVRGGIIRKLEAIEGLRLRAAADANATADQRPIATGAAAGRAARRPD